MGILSRLLQPSNAGAEQRSSLSDPDDTLMEALRGGTVAQAGVSVTPASSLQYSAVLACVRVLSEGVAQLPLVLYERRVDGRGRRRAVEQSLYGLLHTAPNRANTSFELRELMMIHLALWGNAFCEIERNGAGKPLALWPLLPWQVTVHVTADGGRAYEYSQDGFGTSWLRSDQVLHVPAFGYDGVVGKSMIGLARESVGLGIATQRYGASFFSNGARPSVALEHPGQLSDKAYAHLQNSWNERHMGLENAQRMAILEEGMKLNVYGIPPEDAQFLETRKFQRSEIAAIYRVPLHMAGDLERATFSNIEQQSLDFVIYTLTPWLVRIEQRAEMSLLSESERRRFYVEHLVAGLLRGDMASRNTSYATARQWGWLSANDIRELENMNPIEGGDSYLVPMNMIDAGALPSTGSGGGRSGDGRSESRMMAGREVRAAGAGRRRLASAHQPALQDVGQRIVNRESNDISNAARRLMKKEKGPDEFDQWLQRFLEEHHGVVKTQMWATAWALAQLAADEARDEAAAAGYSGEISDDNVELFTHGVVSGRSTHWIERLRAGLQQWIDQALEDGEDPFTAVERYLQQRRDEEAASWSRDIGVALVNAVAVTVFAGVGVQLLRWLSFGESCPYCDSLNGRVVGVEEVFVAQGGEVAPEGHEPLRPHRNTMHPPLHAGCDCMVIPD